MGQKKMMAKAMAGNSTNCPNKPVRMALGYMITLLKSLKSKLRPMPKLITPMAAARKMSVQLPLFMDAAIQKAFQGRDRKRLFYFFDGW